jgi:peptidoglycan/xylan/chitin deacetylase (PgdA/CDA1 family)
VGATGCLGRLDETWEVLWDRDPRVLYSVELAERVVALTIDDGPDPSSTPAILEVLARHEARATFFLIADRIPGNEALVRGLVAAGHDVGNHGVRDRPAVDLPAETFESALLQAHEVLSAYADPRWFRPGSGWYDDEMIETLARHGYRCALGSIYPLDAQIRSATFARRFILWRLQPGGVIILHDGGARGGSTARVLEQLLPALRERGYRVVGLSELVAMAERARTADERPEVR